MTWQLTGQPLTLPAPARAVRGSPGQSSSPQQPKPMVMLGHPKGGDEELSHRKVPTGERGGCVPESEFKKLHPVLQVSRSSRGQTASSVPMLLVTTPHGHISTVASRSFCTFQMVLTSPGHGLAFHEEEFCFPSTNTSLPPWLGCANLAGGPHLLPPVPAPLTATLVRFAALSCHKCLP